MKPPKTWLKLLLIWITAWPAAILVNLLNQSLHGSVHAVFGLAGLCLVVYGLGGWIPALVAFGTRKQ